MWFIVSAHCRLPIDLINLQSNSIVFVVIIIVCTLHIQSVIFFFLSYDALLLLLGRFLLDLFSIVASKNSMYERYAIKWNEYSIYINNNDTNQTLSLSSSSTYQRHVDNNGKCKCNMYIYIVILTQGMHNRMSFDIECIVCVYVNAAASEPNPLSTYLYRII